MPGTCSPLGATSVEILDSLPIGYTASGAFIEFTVNGYINPAVQCDFSSISIKVVIKEELGSIIHYGNITLSNTGSGTEYKSHELDNAEMIYSNITATETSYLFKFTNADYNVPSGSQITVKFPTQLILPATVPTIINTQNLDSPLSASFVYTENTLIIENGFTDALTKDSLIEFEVQNILNPYKLGNTHQSIKIKINTGTGTEYYSKNGGLKPQMDEIAFFPFFKVTPESTTTGVLCNYNIELTVGDGKMNSSHALELEYSADLQICQAEISSISGAVTWGTVTKHDSYNLTIEISAGEIGRQEKVEFSINCMNSYTTHTWTRKFRIQGMKGSDVFYYGTAVVPTMTQIGQYSVFTITKLNDNPKVMNTFQFDVETLHIQSTTIVSNQLLITVPDYLDIIGCNVWEVEGLVGSLSCVVDDHIIQINGIESTAKEFSFSLDGVVNPESTTTAIYFTLTAVHTDGYECENGTSNSVYIVCNYPCPTCTVGLPDNCLSCYESSNTVFGSDPTLHMLYVDGNECVSSCPTHTYPSGTNCLACAAECSECESTDVACTQCYPHTYLAAAQCITFPCPAGYVADDLLWKCLSTLFIYNIYNI